APSSAAIIRIFVPIEAENIVVTRCSSRSMTNNIGILEEIQRWLFPDGSSDFAVHVLPIPLDFDSRKEVATTLLKQVGSTSSSTSSTISIAHYIAQQTAGF
ncbi:unnamed protein product, partial [Amoebophrya sp. A25]